MSWWGTWDKGLSKMATSALKQAQKKIDKVLDIQEGEERNRALEELDRASSMTPSPPQLNSPSCSVLWSHIIILISNNSTQILQAILLVWNDKFIYICISL